MHWIGPGMRSIEEPTHVILGMRPQLGPDGVDAVAIEVAEPLRLALG